MLTAGKIKDVKNKPYTFQSYKPRPGSKESYIDAIKRTGDVAFVRENIFGTEIIWGDERFTFPSKQGRKSMSCLFIYSMVKRDALKYVCKKTKPVKIAPNPIVYNKNVKIKSRKIIGTDIDSAYWSIAYKLGIISENTFNKGVMISEKQILVSALSSLGRDKRYTKVENGVLTDEIMIVRGDDRLKSIYDKVRHKCFSYMKELAKLLGNNFVAYKTDCIYYFETKKNVRTVQSFLDKKGLYYKMVYDYDNIETDY